MPRERGGINLQDALFQALRPFVAAKGKNFVKYSEEKAVHESSQDQALIEDQADLIYAVMSVALNMSFNKTLVYGVMSSLAAEFSKYWHKFQPSMRLEWTECMVRRFRNLCHQVSQAQRKPTRPSWIQKLSFNAKGAPGWRVSGKGSMLKRPAAESGPAAGDTAV